MRHIPSQLGLGARSLARTPGFTAVTILTLAIGIGAVTAIHAMLDRVVLRPLPYPEADRLVAVSSVVPGLEPDEVWGLSLAGYFHFAGYSQTLEAIGAADNVFEDVRLTLSGPTGAVRVPGDSVTSSMFSLLGAEAVRGRLFDETDDRPGAPPVVVLSHEVWTAYFGADPTIVGRTIHVDGTAREVVGIVEPGFRLPGRDTGAWVPLALDRSLPAVNDHWLGAIGRLRPGVTIDEVQAELGRLTDAFPEVFPDAYDVEFMEESGFATRVEDLRAYVIGNAGRVLWTLLGGVGLVLLIALANVTNLFLLRAENRRGEFAIRTAHGASRWHLVGEGLAESLIVGGTAAAVGLLIAGFALDAVVLASPAAIPRISELAIGGNGIAIAGVTGLVAAVLIGPLPRLWARIDLATLREGGRGHTASASRQALRRMLVGAQVALALTLLAAAGLMLRSFDRLLGQDTGVDARNVLTFEVALPSARYGDPAASARFYRDLVDRLVALPGIESAGGTTHLPFLRPDGCWISYSDDRVLPPDVPPPCFQIFAATPGYFETLGIGVRGRIAEWSAVEAGTGTVVVTRALADRLWPGQDPIGKTIRGYSWGDAPSYVVSAVTGDLRADGVDQQPVSAIFLPIVPRTGTPLHWGPFWGAERRLHMVVRSVEDSPERFVPAIRDLLAELDPNVAPGAFETLAGLIARSESVARTSLLVLLLGLAAGIALFLSAVGLYGVVSYFVRQRTREIGLRMALGADVRVVAGAVLRQALHIAVAGVAAGLAATLATTRLLRSLLFEIHPNDPLTLAAAAVALILVTGLAAWLPARRATRIDPIIALRQE